MAFGNFVQIINRTTAPLEATFDGQIVELPAGYVEQPDGTVRRAVDQHGAPVVINLPAHVAAIVKSQHPVMGTQDAHTARPDEYLVGVTEWPSGRKDDTTHIEQSDAIEVIDRDSVDDPQRRSKAEVIKGKGRRTRGAVAATTANLGLKGDFEDAR